MSEAPRCKSALSRVDFVLYSRYCKIHVAARHAGAIGQAFLFGPADSWAPRGARDDDAVERPILRAC